MKEKIESMLRPLIGEPLSDMWRILGMQVFEFGVQRPHKNRKGQDIMRADRRFHVSCPWRITGPEGVIVSGADFGPDKSRRDEGAYPFYDSLRSDAPIVESIEAEDRGAVILRLSRGFVLVLEPVTSTKKPEREQWRFLSDDEGERHLVITSKGTED